MLRLQFRINLVLLMAATTAMAQTGAAQAVDDTALADQYFVSAEKFTKEARFDSAIFSYEKAAQLYEKIASQLNLRSLWEKYVKCYNNLGDVYRRKGDFNNSLAYVDQALKAGRKWLGENHLEVAQSFNYLGNAYFIKREPESALENFNKSLALRTRLLGEMHLEVAKSYNNIGLVYQMKYDFENALAFFNKSLAIKYKLQGDNTLDIARTCTNLGELYRLNGDFELALEFANKALAIKSKVLPANHPEVGGNYTNVGNVYLDQNQLELALENYSQALEIAQRAGIENDPAMAGFYGNLGLVLHKLGKYEEALAIYEKGLANLKKTVGDNRSEMARIYSNTGDLYLLKHDYVRALEYFETALSIRRQTLGEHNPETAENYRGFAKAYLQQNNFKKASEFAHRAILAMTPAFHDTSIYTNPILKNIILETELLPALSLKAQAFAGLFSQRTRDRKDLQMSLSTYQLAVELIDRMRNGYKAEGSKLFLRQNADAVYEEAIRTALLAYETTRAAQHQARAFAFVEKSKAGILAQALQESRAKQFAGVPPSLIEKERNLKIDLAFYETEIEKEKQKTEKQDNLKLGQYQDRYFALKRDYEKLGAQLEKSYPKYFELKYKTTTVTPAEIQKSLDDQTAVVEYFLGNETIFIFAITQNNIGVVAIERDSSFNMLVASLTNSFKNITSKQAYLLSAAQLYDLLFKSVASLIANKPRWLIIPDGELYQIPFEALLTETVSSQDGVDYRTLPYLIKQHEISYHYSATLFLKSSRENSAGSYNNLFAGFAPVFDAAAKNGVIYRDASEDSSAILPVPQADSTFLATRDGKTLESLPYSAREVQDILADFPGRSRVFLQQEASEENFKQQIKGYKYVHLATHGRMVETNPKLSNLTFSQPQIGQAKEDGILYSAETYNLDLNADLLVLSACQTGAGQILKGEGLMSLTRGFFYSGARNIVTSLWKVYDEHTSRLMVEMYRQIAAGKSYSATLREAKLKMIANPGTAAPQSWASFVLIGK